MQLEIQEKARTKLSNKWNADTAFEVTDLDQTCLNKKHQFNTFTIIWVQQGSGHAHFDYSCSFFESHTMLFYSPYQVMELRSKDLIKGLVIHFSNEFLCMEAHKEELSCAGKLFDNLYDPPVLALSPQEVSMISELVLKMQETFDSDFDFGKEEMIQNYLKLLIIQSSRLFVQQRGKPTETASTPDILKQFMALLELKFRTNLLPSDYADELHISSTQLGKLTKQFMHKTPTEVLAERKLIEARRELYLTQKSVKTIAFDLGFLDPHYFSRFFKKNTGISAEEYRKQVGTAAGIFGG
jgi:AraC family transcriptional regulator, transcriptional activator of pobA